MPPEENVYAYFSLFSLFVFKIAVGANEIGLVMKMTGLNCRRKHITLSRIIEHVLLSLYFKSLFNLLDQQWLSRYSAANSNLIDIQNDT